MTSKAKQFEVPEAINLSRRYIEVATNVARVFEETGLGNLVKPPVDIEKIVENFGGKIERVSRENEAWEKLEEGISGTIEVRNVQDFTIQIPESMLEVRNRFPIAHELGHYILHSKQGEKLIRANRDTVNSAFLRVEDEATQFAAALLMPKESFTKEYEKLEKDNHNEEADVIYKLSKKYNVSTRAVSIRLKTLLNLG